MSSHTWVKLKVTSWYACTGTEGKRKYISNPFANSTPEEGCYSAPCSGRFISTEDPVPIKQEVLDGRENLVPTGTERLSHQVEIYKACDGLWDYFTSLEFKCEKSSNNAENCQTYPFALCCCVRCIACNYVTFISRIAVYYLSLPQQRSAASKENNFESYLSKNVSKDTHYSGFGAGV